MDDEKWFTAEKRRHDKVERRNMKLTRIELLMMIVGLVIVVVLSGLIAFG